MVMVGSAAVFHPELVMTHPSKSSLHICRAAAAAAAATFSDLSASNALQHHSS
jgi:hypothetical protein